MKKYYIKSIINNTKIERNRFVKYIVYNDKICNKTLNYEI